MGERSDEAAAHRAALLSDVRRGVTLLSEVLDARNGLVAMRTSARVAGALADVVRMLDTPGCTLAVVGERTSYGLLDAWLGEPVFAGAEVDASTPGPVVTLRRGAVLSYRAQMRDGSVEERRQSAPAPPPKAPVPEQEQQRRSFRDRLRDAWQRLWLRILSLVGRAPALTSGEHVPLEPTLVPRLHEILSVRGAPTQVVELLVTSPAAALAEHVSLVDMRGAMGEVEAIAMVRDRADACLLVLPGGPVGPRLRDLAQALAAVFPHVLVAVPGRPRAEDVALALGLPASRLCLAPVDARALALLAENERALGASARCTAAIRMIAAALDDVVTRDADLDRQALDRYSAHEIDDRDAWRAGALRQVAGACAGRAVRILEGAAAVLEEELARVRAECTVAVESATSRPELQERVAAVGPALRAARAAVEACAGALADRACAELLPRLTADLDRRAAAISAGTDPPSSAPLWPPAPRFDPAQARLVVSDTLSRDDLLHADMRWSDGWLRSLDKVKQRCAAQVAEQLEQVARTARAEILSSEPHVAGMLSQALAQWLDVAAEELSGWIALGLAKEREARDAARAERHAPVISERDGLAACATRLNAGSRNVSMSSHALCARRVPLAPDGVGIRAG